MLYATLHLNGSKYSDIACYLPNLLDFWRTFNYSARPDTFR
jgi:hypothetical protein